MRSLPRLFAGLVVSLALALPVFALETFSDEAKAQQHCPKDTVVWLNLPTMIWRYRARDGTRALSMAPSPARRKQAQQGHGGQETGSEMIWDAQADTPPNEWSAVDAGCRSKLVACSHASGILAIVRYCLHGKYIALAVSEIRTAAHPARGSGARVGFVRTSHRAQGASLARDAADVVECSLCAGGVHPGDP